MTYRSQEPKTCWIWGYTFLASPDDIVRIEQRFRRQPEDLELELLEVRAAWHRSNPNGKESEIVEITRQIHALELAMYDKAEAWAVRQGLTV